MIANISPFLINHLLKTEYQERNISLVLQQTTTRYKDLFKQTPPSSRAFNRVTPIWRKLKFLAVKLKWCIHIHDIDTIMCSVAFLDHIFDD